MCDNKQHGRVAVVKLIKAPRFSFFIIKEMHSGKPPCAFLTVLQERNRQNHSHSSQAKIGKWGIQTLQLILKGALEQF